MDNLKCVDPKFYDTSIGEKIFWFGGQFRELRPLKVWGLTEIFVFGGRKYEKWIVHT